MKKLIASSTPTTDLELVSYEGQPAENRIYHSGLEPFFNELNDLDSMVDEELQEIEKAFNHNARVMDSVSKYVENFNDSFISDFVAPKEGFKRTILAMESPTLNSLGKIIKEGKEIVVALWGRGFKSPVHGHSEGMLYERLIDGKMLINLYRIVDLENKTVRLVETILQEPELIVKNYTPIGTHKMYKRESYVHNFEAIEPSVSVHYVPEHTRDGRDNQFKVEHFELDYNNVAQINTEQGLYSAVGDVILVRSENVPQYKYHYIVITGRPVMKEHGMRPQDRVVMASERDTEQLDSGYWKKMNGVILLKLNKEEKRKFHEFHGIKMSCNKVIFPNL
jgi:hypothetical protein